MSRPLHSHRAQNHFKPGEPLPFEKEARKKRERRGTPMSQSLITFENPYSSSIS